jgi:putative ABC transport system permease protein
MRGDFRNELIDCRARLIRAELRTPMTFFLHLRRNLTRNKGRTLGLVLVVGLTLGIFLILGQVSASIVSYSGQVEASVPNIITVQPSSNFIGGGYFSITIGPGSTTGLNSSAVRTISETPNVASVQRVITQPLQLPSTSSGGGGPPSTSSGGGGSFTCGTASDPQVLGEDTTSQLKLVLGGLSGAGSVTVTDGRTLGPSDENGTSALVSQQYATANGLAVGSPLGVDGHEFMIVGIFSQSCYTLILPYPAAASALGVSDASIIYVVVNQYQNVAGALSSLQSRLGSSFNVQILANADRGALQDSISAILVGSRLGEYATLTTGAAVMVVVMVLMTSRRTKEVGLLKALGYGSGRILGQILLESLIFAALGLPVALAISLLAGPLVSQSLLGQIGNPNSLGISPSDGGNVPGHPSGSNPFLQNIHFTLTPETVILGLTITVAFGLFGALYPSVRALLLRPSEALRRE